MSLTRSDRYYHAIYEALPRVYRDAINQAYTQCTQAIVTESSRRLLLRCDDRAEVLVAAITRYVVESNPDNPEIQAAVKAVNREGVTL